MGFGSSALASHPAKNNKKKNVVVDEELFGVPFY